jgi:hypothetical protein
MAQFILFMRGSSAGFRAMSPEEIQTAIQKYSDWARFLASQGKLRGGEKLRDDGVRVVRSDKGKLVLDGPFPETKETIGGYFIVEAAGYDEAAKLAMACPVYSYGGTVEVREIEPDQSRQK